MAMQTVIQREVQFDAGHRVPEHRSKCRHPHGHRYRVVVHVTGRVVAGGPEDGMVMDFGRIKALLAEHVHDPFDHGFLVHADDMAMRHALHVGSQYEQEATNLPAWNVIPLPFAPTAENLAAHFFRVLDAPFRTSGITLLQLDVWETPTCCATVVR